MRVCHTYIPRFARFFVNRGTVVFHRSVIWTNNVPDIVPNSRVIYSMFANPNLNAGDRLFQSILTHFSLAIMSILLRVVSLFPHEWFLFFGIKSITIFHFQHINERLAILNCLFSPGFPLGRKAIPKNCWLYHLIVFPLF